MCCFCKVHKMVSKWVDHVCAHISSAQLLDKRCSRVGLAGFIGTFAVSLIAVLVTLQSLTYNSGAFLVQKIFIKNAEYSEHFDVVLPCITV